jgi:hypothetical protein
LRIATAHDYKRHSTATLFAALNVVDGSVIGRNMQRHCHQEFIRFLNTIEAQVPAAKVIHAILDNYGAHKQSKSRPDAGSASKTPTKPHWKLRQAAFRLMAAALRKL